MAGGFAEDLRDGNTPSLMDAISRAADQLADEKLGKFVAVL